MIGGKEMGEATQRLTLKAAATSIILAALAIIPSRMPAGAAEPVAAQQGPDWTDVKRAEFYSLDQGSRLMPLKWIMALKQADGAPFMADKLQRYGFLANPWNLESLPLGFTTGESVATGESFVGMTCAACHTRQIEAGGIAYRIDGGPAIIDFQGFLSDLNAAVGRVVQDQSAFTAFASTVLEGSYGSDQETALRQEVGHWHERFDAFTSRGLPPTQWGPGRADATGMIFNRLTGLTLGESPSLLIVENIQPAAAPVRYPFLWNSDKQNKTQWPGFVKNDKPFVPLLRNIGQVLGVFATCHPTKEPGQPVQFDKNCVNISNLLKLESLAANIGPPVWPWGPLNQNLVEKGKEIYGTAKCRECHDDAPARGNGSWETPIRDVGTDVSALKLLERDAFTGVLMGATTHQGNDALAQKELALKILNVSVLGIWCDYLPSFCPYASLQNSFQKNESGYEARVLHGIWAAAPYLHNGSVPTLAELLKPAAERTASFQIGSAYDPVAVGLARDQTQFSFTLKTTDCTDIVSGNSRCGHDYGTDLSAEDKRALLEYLKQL